MSEEVTTQSEAKWAIDLNWLKTNGRSFFILTRDTLCTKCQKKLKADTIEVKAADLLKAIQSCCSKTPDFITPSLPFQESIFRVFLANGNKPLTLGELGEQLSQWRGIDVYRTSATFLSRLIKSDQYYGIKSKSV
jgi:hypothetical protein